MNKKLLSDEPGSVLTRLLSELSWEGSRIKNYREGGRKFENVLTAEVLQALDFLPRKHFMGEVLRHAHGVNCAALNLLVEQVEEAEMQLLPGGDYLRPNDDSHITGISVQPDGIIETSGVCCLLEAKRIKRSLFGVEQLAREYFLVTRNCEEKLPLLFLVLGTPPPVSVNGRGIFEIVDAVRLSLSTVYEKAESHPLPLADLDKRIPESVAWITWNELGVIVESQSGKFKSGSASIDGSVRRLTISILDAIKWHT